MFKKIRHRRRHKLDTTPESVWARVSVFMILLTVFVLVGFRNVDKLVISLVVSVISFLGWVIAIKAQKQLRRRRGVLQGEGTAALGYWGNLILMLLFLLAFCWFFAMGVLRGDLL